MGNDTQSGVVRIFATILRSLAKILIKNNIPLANSVEIMKRALVEAALEEGQTTDSQISLKTGVHRKDVNRLRTAIRDGVVQQSPIKGLAMVMSVWAHDPRFQDADAHPRVLPRKGAKGAPGFDDLIRASKVDLAPATVLKELAAQALIAVHKDGGIELLSTTFVAQSGEAALRAFEATITDHVRIAANNILAEPGASRDFDQVLRYSHLSAASVEALEAEARLLAQSYLEQLNALAHRLQRADDESGQLANGRFVTGTYVAPVLPDSGAGCDLSMTTSDKKDEAE
ncbi:MAG: DUF6502 family protein [Arenibacterium sp.]